jgi:hypothetical protein
MFNFSDLLPESEFRFFDGFGGEQILCTVVLEYCVFNIQKCLFYNINLRISKSQNCTFNSQKSHIFGEQPILPNHSTSDEAA